MVKFVVYSLYFHYCKRKNVSQQLYFISKQFHSCIENKVTIQACLYNSFFTTPLNDFFGKCDISNCFQKVAPFFSSIHFRHLHFSIEKHLLLRNHTVTSGMDPFHLAKDVNSQHLSHFSILSSEVMAVKILQSIIYLFQILGWSE